MIAYGLWAIGHGLLMMGCLLIMDWCQLRLVWSLTDIIIVQALISCCFRLGKIDSFCIHCDTAAVKPGLPMLMKSATDQQTRVIIRTCTASPLIGKAAPW